MHPTLEKTLFYYFYWFQHSEKSLVSATERGSLSGKNTNLLGLPWLSLSGQPSNPHSSVAIDASSGRRERAWQHEKHNTEWGHGVITSYRLITKWNWHVSLVGVRNEPSWNPKSVRSEIIRDSPIFPGSKIKIDRVIVEEVTRWYTCGNRKRTSKSAPHVHGNTKSWCGDSKKWMHNPGKDPPRQLLAHRW